MILFLLSKLEKKIESIYSLTEGANNDMSKQDLLLIIKDISDKIEGIDTDLKVIMKKRKYFRNV